MTVEAKSKILGIPFLTRKLSHIDGEMWIGIQREVDIESDEDKFIPTTFRVISDDEIAFFRYYPEANNPKKLKRAAPVFLNREEINKANLHTNGVFYRVDFRWKPTK